MLLYQKPSCEWETGTVKGTLNSVGFVCLGKIHELLSSQLYLNIFYTLENCKANRYSNHLHLLLLLSIFLSKSLKIQNLSTVLSGKSNPLQLKILFYEIKGFMDYKQGGGSSCRGKLNIKSPSGGNKKNNNKNKPSGGRSDNYLGDGNKESRQGLFATSVKVLTFSA